MIEWLEQLLYGSMSPDDRGMKSESGHHTLENCTARQCSPLRRKFMERSIINPALSLLAKHLLIGQRQKPLNFSAFHWSPQDSLVSIGQRFVTTRAVHLPKRTETSLITESDRSGPNRTRLCGLCMAVIAASPCETKQLTII